MTQPQAALPAVNPFAAQRALAQEAEQQRISAAVGNALAQALGSIRLGVDETAVRALIEERLAALEPAKLILRGDSAPVRLEQHTHPLFEKVLRLMNAGLNVLLVGPAGCGKSHLVEQAAKALKAEVAATHCTAGLSESALSGWLLPVGDGGRFRFVPAAFAALYERGDSVLFVDEIDNGDANTLGFLNGALANGHLHIPQSYDKPVWKRGPRVRIVAAANTFGTGADMLYVGRNQLDAATLDRFYVVQMDYDSVLEAQIAGLARPHVEAWKPNGVQTQEARQALAQWVLRIRGRAGQLKLRRVVSTRAVQKAVAAYDAGIPPSEIKVDLLAGWSADERVKAGA